MTDRPALVRDLDDHLAVIESVRSMVPDVEAVAEEIRARFERGGALYSSATAGRRRTPSTCPASSSDVTAANAARCPP